MGIKFNFYCLLCEKDKKTSIIVDKQPIGTLMINLNDSWKTIYFLENQLIYFFDNNLNTHQ